MFCRPIYFIGHHCHPKSIHHLRIHSPTNYCHHQSHVSTPLLFPYHYCPHQILAPVVIHTVSIISLIIITCYIWVFILMFSITHLSIKFWLWIFTTKNASFLLYARPLRIFASRVCIASNASSCLLWSIPWLYSLGLVDVFKSSD